MTLRSPTTWLVSVALAVSPAVASAQEDHFVDLAPIDGRPYTAAVEVEIRQAGGECLAEGPQRRNREVVDEAFVACMSRRGYARVPRPDHDALQILGRLEDCTAGRTLDCANAVATYAHGIPGTRLLNAPTGAIATGMTLCRRGLGDVCLTIGSLWLTGFRDSPPDVELALDALTIGCEAGHVTSCGLAGAVLVGDYDQRARDVARGGRYLAMACKGGLVPACAWPPKPATPK